MAGSHPSPGLWLRVSAHFCQVMCGSQGPKLWAQAHPKESPFLEPDRYWLAV